MKNLFEITQEYLAIYDQLLENEGELTPELAAALEISQKDLASKGLNYVHIIKKYENEIAGLKVYEEQIAKLKKRKNKAIEFLEERLLEAVNRVGEIETELFKITTRKSESIEILDIDKIAARYLVPKTTYTPDKAKIKADIKQGLEVDGAELKENKNLSIR